MIADHTATHWTTAGLARNYDSLGDLGRQAGRPARRGAVATRQPLDPIRLPFAELLHVVKFRFFQEVDGSARVSQHVEGRDIVVLAFEETTVITAVTTQTCRQGCLRAAHVHVFAGRRGDAVDAP